MSTFIKRDREGKAIDLPQARSVSEVKPAKPPHFKRSTARLLAGLAIAMAADGLNVAFPLLPMPVDFVAAILISLLFGWRWETIAVTIAEAFPMTSLFPTWVIFVFYLNGVKTVEKTSM